MLGVHVGLQGRIDVKLRDIHTLGDRLHEFLGFDLGLFGYSDEGGQVALMAHDLACQLVVFKMYVRDQIIVFLNKRAFDTDFLIGSSGDKGSRLTVWIHTSLAFVDH